MKSAKSRERASASEQSSLEPQPYALSPDNLEIVLLCAQRDHLLPGWWRHPQLANDHWRLYQNDVSGGWLQSGERRIPLKAREVYLLPSAIPLSSDNDESLRQFFIHFDLRGFPPIIFHELFQEPVSIPHTSYLSEATFELGLLVEKSGWIDFGVQCLLKGLVYAAFGHYFNAMPPEMVERCRGRVAALAPVLPALQHIHERMEQPIMIGDLAAACSMSENYFIRRFREAVGAPPLQYLLKRRVAHAAQRLLFTEDTIDKIAEESGFSDRFYFSRVFTREIGTPPAAYRRGSRS
ncbi:MAG: AraC family transcriptional regulator [Capsulimonas sp.]|uniref:AraC family transcriptional regulator n=1 Tax=Capsulimonas sp. TaxID=2494211 RepID=UPI00326428DF